MTVMLKTIRSLKNRQRSILNSQTVVYNQKIIEPFNLVRSQKSLPDECDCDFANCRTKQLI